MCFVMVMIVLLTIAVTATAIVLPKFHHEEKPAGVVDEGVPVAPVLGHQDHPQQAGQVEPVEPDVAHTTALDDGLVPVADPGRGDVLDQGDDQLEVGQDVEEHDNKKKNVKYIFVGIAFGILGMTMFICMFISFACQKCCRAGPPPMPPPNPTAPSLNPLQGSDVERLLVETEVNLDEDS